MDVCAVCGAGAPVRAGRVAAAAVRECAACGFAACDPLPRLESDSAGPFSIATDPEYSARLLDLSPERRAAYERLAAHRHRAYARLLGRSTFRLLEVGCGSAGLGEPLGRLGVAYDGIELDARMVRHARGRGLAGVRQGDLMSLEGGPWDVVAASQVLEHIVAPRAFVERLHALLAPGGVVHLDVPNHAGLAGRVMGPLSRGRRRGGIEWPHHAMAYRARTLRRLLEPWFEGLTVFSANPDHPTYGQAVALGLPARAFYLLSRVAGAGSLLVALGRRRER